VTPLLPHPIQSAVESQRIEVERGEVGVAFDAQITSALVVGENDDDVQARGGRGFTGHTG
jgi:hypothetical protein